ncbi:MAG TPA: hypothetical protein VHH34_01465 [Pseudonocardiaceae bacterium]|nr:hypothetical protein [Pseudonocardiaceae bacterium]
MIIPVGPEPEPEHRWVGADAARRVRSRCTVTALVLLLWALVAGATMLPAGFRLPTADHPINGVGVLLAAVSAVLLLATAIGVLGARRYVAAEHVDVAGGRVLGRVLLALGVSALGCAALSGAVLLLTAGAVERSAPAGNIPAGNVTAAVGGYLLLPVSCGMLAVLGAVLTRRVLRPAGAGGPSRVRP